MKTIKVYMLRDINLMFYNLLSMIYLLLINKKWLGR